MDFSGYQHPSDIILLAVPYYVSYNLSYRDIEEIFIERGSYVDHSTINRWVINFAPMIESKVPQMRVSDHLLTVISISISISISIGISFGAILASPICTLILSLCSLISYSCRMIDFMVVYGFKKQVDTG